MPPRRANWPGRSTASTRSKLLLTSHSTDAFRVQVSSRLSSSRAFPQGRGLGNRLTQGLNRGRNHQVRRWRSAVSDPPAATRSAAAPHASHPSHRPVPPRLPRRAADSTRSTPKVLRSSNARSASSICGTDVQNRPMERLGDVRGQQAQRIPRSPRLAPAPSPGSVGRRSAKPPCRPPDPYAGSAGGDIPARDESGRAEQYRCTPLSIG